MADTLPLTHQQTLCGTQRNCDAQMHQNQPEAQQILHTAPTLHNTDLDHWHSQSAWGLFMAMDRTPDHRKDVLWRPEKADEGYPDGGQMPEEVSQDNVEVLRDTRALSPKMDGPLGLGGIPSSEDACTGVTERGPLCGTLSERARTFEALGDAQADPSVSGPPEDTGDGGLRVGVIPIPKDPVQDDRWGL